MFKLHKPVHFQNAGFILFCLLFLKKGIIFRHLKRIWPAGMIFPPDFFNSLCNEDVAVIDNFLPESQYNAICNMAEKLYQAKQFKPSGIGRLQRFQNNDSIRNDEIYWLESNAPALPSQFLMSALTALMESLNQTFFLSLIEFEAHFAVYQPGSYYKKHRDQFRDNDARMISCVYYLNPEWAEDDGGHLLIYQQNQLSHRLLPQGNRLVCFKSHLLHEVEVTRKQRLSLTAWIKRRCDGTLG